MHPLPIPNKQEVVSQPMKACEKSICLQAKEPNPDFTSRNERTSVPTAPRRRQAGPLPHQGAPGWVGGWSKPPCLASGPRGPAHHGRICMKAWRVRIGKEGCYVPSDLPRGVHALTIQGTHHGGGHTAGGRGRGQHPILLGGSTPTSAGGFMISWGVGMGH